MWWLSLGATRAFQPVLCFPPSLLLEENHHTGHLLTSLLPSRSSLQASHPLLRAPESEQGPRVTPVGTILSPCSARCWISLSSFYQHDEDHNLHRLQVTYLKLVGPLVFFSILCWLCPSCIFWPSSSCHHSFSNPFGAGLACAECTGARNKLLRSPSPHQH